MPLPQSLKEYVELFFVHLHLVKIERNLILPIIQIQVGVLSRYAVSAILILPAQCRKFRMLGKLRYHTDHDGLVVIGSLTSCLTAG